MPMITCDLSLSGAILLPLAAFDASAAKIIIFLVIGAFYAISHLVKVLKNAQAQNTRRAANVDQAEVRKKLEGELEGFLKRARGEAARPPEPPRPKERKKQRKLAAESRPLSERVEPTSKRLEPLAERAPPVVAQVVEPPSRFHPQSERQHLDTTNFDRRAANMTHISRESEEMASHVHETFDHQLGSLGGRATNQAEGATASNSAPVSVAPQLAAMLADPQSMRQAIILQEILNRPEHRW